MNEKQLKALIAKMDNKTATPAEKLLFLQEFNSLIKNLRKTVLEAKDATKISKIRNSI